MYFIQCRVVQCMVFVLVSEVIIPESNFHCEYANGICNRCVDRMTANHAGLIKRVSSYA